VFIVNQAMDTMQTVTEIAHDILKTEGGYVNDPDDPGGPTRFGVTLKTLRRLRYDLTGDGRVDIDDLKRLTPEQAIEIFIQNYFYRPKINKLPNILHACVFDMQVNSGASAIKILQKVLLAFGQSIAVDGVIGPKTIIAANNVAQMAPDHLVDAYGIERRAYYLGLADRSPRLRKFARTQSGSKGGLIKRAERFIKPKYHLSSDEFEKRTAKWRS
jgi:lysozyme family protein